MKISKTIKRLRSERGMTQEALAEKLFITRQSVSSWENDRTQPDIEMLGKLSEIFDVSIEELIYGHKRNLTLETKKPDYNSTLMIVFSILGSLLAGVGVVLIFVTFWQKMPMFFKAVLSLLPLLAGQSAGVFVLLKKREKLPWCEGAAVLWTAGIAATLAMIYNIFDLEIYWHTVLIIISVCIIPVLGLLKAVSPLVVYYACAIIWLCAAASSGTVYLMLSLVVLLLAGGCIFSSRLVKKENKSVRSLYSQWVSAAAVLALAVCTAISFSVIHLIFSAVGTVGICLLLLSLRDADIVMPYRLPGLLLTSFMLFASGAIYYGNLDRSNENIIFAVLQGVAVLLCGLYIIFTKTKGKDIFFNAYIAVSALSIFVFLIAYFRFPDSVSALRNKDEIFKAAMKIVAVIANILLMISGGREKKLASINLGFTSVAALTLLFVYQSGLSMIANGFLLLIFGGVLLAINFRLSRKNVKKDMAVINEEVADNDTES